MTRCMLLGTGTAVPHHSIDQADAAAIVSGFGCETAEQRQFLANTYHHSTIQRRHSVVLERSDGPLAQRQQFFLPASDSADRGPTTAERLREYHLKAPVLASNAAVAALNSAQVSPEEITQLVTVSCTGFHAPGVDLALFDSLNLAAETSRTHVGFMGCHGALNGLRVARTALTADANAKVLLVAVELCSLHQQYGFRPDQVVANALFADGAAAVVCGQAVDRNHRWELAAQGSIRWPDPAAMTWAIGDHGFEMTLARQVPALIRRNLRAWLESWLARQGLTVAEIPSWAIHPGGPRIVGSVAAALDLSSSQTAPSEEVLRDFGNMSSPTVLFILRRLQEQHAPLPAVAIAFGPGLVCEVALFR